MVDCGADRNTPSTDADARLLHPSGFHHACFALRHESRLDEEPLSHEAIIEPGRLIKVLEKGLLYMSVEAHIDEVSRLQRSPSSSTAVTLTQSFHRSNDGA